MTPAIVEAASTGSVATGSSAPLGASILPGGVNFSVFSKNATLIELLLFDDGAAPEPARNSMRYWATEMHVDGFRFDLASILSRDEAGKPLRNPPVRWDIESDPLLAGTKLIAEAWDCAGLYQVGSFVGDTWQEWNGRFRDDVRRFLKSDNGSVSRLATRLLGSPDIYGHEEREAKQSINFVTCHDGLHAPWKPNRLSHEFVAAGPPGR